MAAVCATCSAFGNVPVPIGLTSGTMAPAATSEVTGFANLDDNVMQLSGKNLGAQTGIAGRNYMQALLTAGPYDDIRCGASATRACTQRSALPYARVSSTKLGSV